jgi:hypothetical protein
MESAGFKGSAGGSSHPETVKPNVRSKDSARLMLKTVLMI